jgi:hypothetical protein
MLNYLLKGDYDLMGTRASFEGFFMRDHEGDILGEIKIGGNSSDTYELTGRFLPFRKCLLLEFIATGDIHRWLGKDVPLDCQFIKHGSTTNFIGSFGGGIRIASEGMIQALRDGKNPLQQEHDVWAIYRTQRNANLVLRSSTN